MLTCISHLYFKNIIQKVCTFSQMRWYIPVIPALGRQRQKDYKFSQPDLHKKSQPSLDYIVKLCLKQMNKHIQKKKKMYFLNILGSKELSRFF
jgi:hypothetical protein